MTPRRPARPSPSSRTRTGDPTRARAGERPHARSDRPAAKNGEPGRGEQRPPAESRRHGSIGAHELAYYGRSCCRALFERRPEQIVRVYLETSLRKDHGDLLKYCASRKVAYHLAGSEDLERVTRSAHHEGVCIVARKLPVLDAAELLAKLPPTGPLSLLFLDGVENPHNVGALLRTAAHFGAVGLIYAGDEPRPLSGAACRIAEGGAEAVPLARSGPVEQFFPLLREHGIEAVMTSSHASTPLFSASLPTRALFVLGSEGTGISGAITRFGSQQLAIPGSGAIESLNVGVAGAILLAEHWRRYNGAHFGE